MATYKVEIGHYDGQGGSLRARAFIADVDNAIIAGGITDARMAGLAKTALRGEARTWLETQVQLETAGLGLWSTLKPLLVQEFSAPLTMVELASLEKSLEHKVGERVSAFYVRCQRYHLEEDADLLPAMRGEDIYKEQFARRVKFSFMKGIRSEIRSAMAGLNVQEATAAELLTAAKNAEILTMKKGTAPGGAGPSTENKQQGAAEQEISALEAGLSEDSKAILAIMERRFFNAGRGRGGRGGGGRGRGGRGGRGGGNPTPPLEVLQAREKAQCNRCGKWVKHRAKECFVNLDNQRGGRGGQARGRGGRGGQGGQPQNFSYAQAAGAMANPEDEFVVYDDGQSKN
jgi:hypothetical protein